MFDIENLKANVLVKFPIFKGIILNARYIVDYSLKTASTDGKNVYYNPSFMTSLNFDEQLFILMHEICHIAFDHIKRLAGRNLEAWNFATDAVINELLVKEGLIPPEGLIFMDDSWGNSAEVVYDYYIKKHPEAQSEEIKKKTANHSYWVNKPVLTDEAKENYGHPINEDELEKAIEELSQQGEESVFEDNRKNYKQHLEDLNKQMKQLSANKNSRLNSDSSDISVEGQSRTLISWQKVLKKYSKKHYDWSFEDVEAEYGIINPTLKKYDSAETEIVIDASYSISDDLIRNFLLQCIQILNYSKVRIGFFDDKFYGFKNVTSKSQINDMKIPSGGGTNFDVAVSAFSKKKINKIILTDGLAADPKDFCDALWIVIGDRKINPPGGSVIYVDANQFINGHGKKI